MTQTQDDIWKENRGKIEFEDEQEHDLREECLVWFKMKKRSG